MSDLHPSGAERGSQFHECRYVVDIGAVDHRIDGEREPKFHDRSREHQLAGMRAGIVGDVVRDGCIYVLQRELNMIQSQFPQPREARTIEADRRGDKVGVQPGRMRHSNDLGEIAA